jgi:hypothetical protein
MAKGMFSQGVCLLTNGKTTMDAIKEALNAGGFEVVKETPANEHTAFGGPTVIVPYLPEVNGYAAVDVVNEPWPDSMGDPKADPITFGAWSFGNFGPLAFPSGLARAGQHSWSLEQGRTVAEGHRGYIRARISYVFGARDDFPVMPKDYQPIPEMMFLSRMVLALFDVPGVICYYNPNGEVLRDSANFCEVWDACEKQENVPLPLWMNVRFFNLNERLGLMDTVGNGQLDLRDVEALFPFDKYEPGDVSYYLRNVTHYLLGLDREMKSGEAIDGPGESDPGWTVEVLDAGAVEPPRRVLRLYPKANRKEIREALALVGQ